MDENIKILLVEDELALRNITVSFLRKNGIETDVTGNGNEACLMVEKNRYDCVVLDIMMPGRDGREVCCFIREKYDVPVIFLTALGTDSDIENGYEIGADEYLTKPFSTKYLLMKIKALVKRYRGLLVKDGRITVDELVIEPAKRKVMVNGSEVALAPKEYDLLMYLIDHKNNVLSRDMILDRVWGMDYEGFDRAVDTHIKKLRAALGSAGAHIETVIKAGYRWKSR